MNQAAERPGCARRFRDAGSGIRLRKAGGAALVALVAIAALAAVHAPAAHAQEVQVPLDRSGRIQRIDAQLAKRLGTMTDRYPGFTEARLFRAPDSTFALEVTMARGGQVLRERLPLSPTGVDSLRDRITLLIAQKAPQATMNQEGRPLLVTCTTLLGLGFYGWALPYAGDVNESQVAAGIYMLTAAGSFFIPFALTGDQAVTYGMTDHALYGTTRGIIHGILVYQLFSSSDNTSQGNVGAATFGSIVEGAGNYYWAASTHMSAGDAQTIGTLGDFGLLEGLGATNLADTYDQDRNAQGAAIMLAGSAVGLAGGAVLARHRDYSYGDASVMRNAGLLGVFAADMIADWFNPSDKTYVTAAMIGAPVGLALGDRLVANTDFNVGQSVIITLGMTAGAALGLGIVYVSSGGSGDHGTLNLTSSMLGSAVGFATTYSSLLPAARAGRTKSSWRIEMSPLAALAAAAPRPEGSAPSAGAGAPLVRVSYRF